MSVVLIYYKTLSASKNKPISNVYLNYCVYLFLIFNIKIMLKKNSFISNNKYSYIYFLNFYVPRTQLLLLLKY